MVDNFQTDIKKEQSLDEENEELDNNEGVRMKDNSLAASKNKYPSNQDKNEKKVLGQRIKQPLQKINPLAKKKSTQKQPKTEEKPKSVFEKILEKTKPAVPPSDSSSQLVNQITESAQKKALDFSFYLIILIVAVVKDILEMVIALIPFLDLLGFIISIPFSIIIFVLLILFGRFGLWQTATLLVSQLLDMISIVNFLPITTITVLVLILLERSKLARSAAQVVTKIKQPLKSSLKSPQQSVAS